MCNTDHDAFQVIEPALANVKSVPRETMFYDGHVTTLNIHTTANRRDTMPSFNNDPKHLSQSSPASGTP